MTRRSPRLAPTGPSGSASVPGLLVGIVRRPHGLRGEVSVQVLTDFPERFATGTALHWSRGAESRGLTVFSVRPHGKRLLLRFEEIDSAESAAALSGGELSIAPKNAVPPPSGFFYSHEIEGWLCESSSGGLFGSALGLEQTPAGPLLRLSTAARREVLIPFVWPIVVSVDRDRRRIVLDPPEGLLDL